MTWSDGSDVGRYDGEFRGGWQEGEGTYTAPNGREFSGRWIGDRLNGKHRYDDLNGEARRLGPPPSSSSSSPFSFNQWQDIINKKETNTTSIGRASFEEFGNMFDSPPHTGYSPQYFP